MRRGGGGVRETEEEVFGVVVLKRTCDVLLEDLASPLRRDRDEGRR